MTKDAYSSLRNISRETDMTAADCPLIETEKLVHSSTSISLLIHFKLYNYIYLMLRSANNTEQSLLGISIQCEIHNCKQRKLSCEDLKDQRGCEVA